MPSNAPIGGDEDGKQTGRRSTKNANGKKSSSDTAIVNMPGSTPSPTFPFRYDFRQHSGCCQTLKMILVGLVLFVPRLLLLIIGFLNLWITSALMLCCVSEEALETYPLKRPIGRFLLRFWARVILFALGYWWITTEDKRDEDSYYTRLGGSKFDKDYTAPVIVANHVSFVDAFYFAYADNPMAVAKAEILRAPIVGTITRATQTIGVARETKSQDGKKPKFNVGTEIDRRTQWRLTQNAEVLRDKGVFPPLLIFPEATCTNGSSIIQFKTGAFHPMMPVQPVTLNYHQKHLDVSWVGPMSVPLTMVRMMCQVYNKLHVHYLPVMNTIPNLKETPADFAENVRDAIANDLKVPKSNHNFLDVLLMREVHMLRLPQSKVNVEMGSYPDGLSEAKKNLREFAALDKDGDGLLDASEFSAMLGLTSDGSSDSEEEQQQQSSGEEATSTIVGALMSKWDTDGDGKINFREFLLFGAVLKARHLVRHSTTPVNGADDSPDNSNQAAEDAEELRHAFALCFGAFDSDCDGRVLKQEFTEGLAKIAPQVNAEEATRLFDTVDSDKDHVVSMNEYLDYCHEHPVLMLTFLDAIAVSDPDLLSPEDTAEIQSLSRENSFLQSHEDGENDQGHQSQQPYSPAATGSQQE